ncbi:GNAT family N-acetyltransferase [Brevibacillus ruminantium]|uniref:GNAT family N-acetyltransferase n=1 Tax=Brevibacillus ruminantium TaxID=2950604 RepID=A0ABY4WFP4_9BACL|nr:GNAT family N-acetyltransferase [Brevibacillus ruminantium]USG64832.1 GNAT family N-acetyltransferase [Brevibacillus ruminantium]
MDFTLIKASPEDKEILQNLLQLYIYDFSEFIDADVNERGYFEYSYLHDYWTDEDRFPFLIQTEKKWAGFVLVRKINNEDTRLDGYYSIAEFFILRKYRRNGLGKAVAQQIFRMFPGNWDVFQLKNNLPAQAFWKNTIGEYTNGNFQEGENDKGVFQLFTSSAQ